MQLPDYTNSVLLPAIASDLGILRFSCGVRRIGLTGADLGPAAIGDEKKTALSVGAVHVDYSLSGLLGKHVSRVSFSGLDLECDIEKGKIVFPGFDPQSLISKFGKKHDAPSEESGKTFSFGRIEIRNAMFVCQLNGRPYRIPFQIEITHRPPDNRQLFCDFKLFPRGQEIACVVFADLDKKTADAKLLAGNILLDAFADFTEDIPDLLLSGQAGLMADARLRLDPFAVSSFRASVRFSNVATRYGDVRFLKYGENGEPAWFDAEYGGNDKWELALGNLAIDSPFPVRIPDLDCHADLSNGIELGGNASVVVGGKNCPQSFDLPTPLVLKEKFSINISPNGDWNFHLADSNPAPDGFEILPGGFKCVARAPKIDFSGKGNGSKGKVKIGLAISDMRGSIGETRIDIPSLTFKAEADFDGSAALFPKTAAFRIDAPDTTVQTGGISVKSTELSFSGVAKGSASGSSRYDGFLKFAKAGVDSRESGFNVGGIQGTIPLRWPYGESGPEGPISAAFVKIGKKNIGSVKGTVRQVPTGLEYNVLHKSRFISGVSLEMDGRSIFDAAGFATEIDFHTLPCEIDIDLGKFFKSGRGVAVGGKPSMEGRFSFAGGKSECTMDFTLDNGSIRFPNESAVFKGVHAGLVFTDLFDLKSAPEQVFRFDKASFGDISISEGRLDYQIESGGTFFLENGSFKWCNGSVFGQATRITPGIEDYDLTLYCDRLNLAMLLEQMGVGNVRGKGTVNGRIPIRYADGKLGFNDGFLFSTPGDGGSIHVTGMEHLTEGIPEGSLEYAQIELAREALKDFEYNWAKLQMVSKGDDELELRLGFDGKPAHPLPFVFDKELGGFSKMTAGGRKSHFQGIRLDVNVHLPLNEMLRYKDFIKLIQ